MHKRGLKPRETSHNIMAGLLKEIEEEEWKEGLANVKLKARKKLQTKKVQSGEQVEKLETVLVLKHELVT